MKSLHSENLLDMSSSMKMYELRAGERGWPGVAHAHTYFQLWYIRSGNCVHRVGGQVCVLGPGEILLVPPYVVHTAEAGSGGCCIYACDIAQEMLTADPVLQQPSDRGEGGRLLDVLLQVRGKYTLTDPARSRAESILGKMLDIYRKPDPYGEMELKGCC